MRIERWYSFLVFCLLSFGVHVGLAIQSRSMTWGHALVRHVTPQVEVTLEAPEPKPLPAPPIVKPEPRPKTDFGEHKTTPPKQADVAMDTQHVRLPPPEAPKTPTPPSDRVKVAVTEDPEPPVPQPVPTPPGGEDKLKDERPVALGQADAPRQPAAPRFNRLVRSEPTINIRTNIANQGGGSPAPDANLSGKGGAPGPEAPPEDTIYAGGGAGGEKLPKAPARAGGGGGASILAANNPLAKEAVPEEKAGLGPGTGGGAGTGSGGGAGFRAGKGIGTRSNGRDALATLNSKPGNGIGAGQGNKIGTQAPGGGKGTGAETPGTGGDGTGYGRGKGIAIGTGTGSGPGTSAFGGGSDRLAGASRPSFGDLAGLLRGDPAGGGGTGGGPGGAGKGAGGGFGTVQQTPFSLKGDIYLLDPGTPKLPDFTKLKSIGSIYTNELNIPTRHFDRGFPGVTDRFEWFAIDYNGTFTLKKPTNFKFKLTSDDGSKLLIDDQLIIDNDGQHSTQMREGSVSLKSGKHTIEIQYFQGPKDELALVLEIAAE